MAQDKRKEFGYIREELYQIIFEAETPLGKAFDITLLIFIIGSVLAVMLESVDHLDTKYHQIFFILEWVFTVFFTIEYILRIYCVLRPIKYITSFFGIIDLLAVLPAYISFFFPGTQYFLLIRLLRLVRIFRIFKLAKFLRQSDIIVTALKESRPKITVFLVFVILLVTLMGSLMYFVEAGEGSGFTSIPRSIYWAVVTVTTVGYGDIAPNTPFGQFLSACLMIMGYAVIAVPTGIVSAELVTSSVKSEEQFTSTRACQHCSMEGHDLDAEFCKFCGEQLRPINNEE